MKTICFYLPQFHPIPENDKWWGKGFTEWTHVKIAQPRFPGHHQPHIPGQFGYYDLREPAVREAQAKLAAEHGIHGFCYYHYWFNGKRLLEFPFNEVLRTGEPQFPFCLCWANENWTRRWDGAEQKTLMAQNYNDEDSLNLINTLVPAFRDERYIRINGKPLFLVYRTGLMPDPKKTAEIWREAAVKAGFIGLYLARVENFLDGNEPAPDEIGFDAAVEFAPYWGSIGGRVTNLSEAGFPSYDLNEDLNVYDYETVMRSMLSRPTPPYRLFRGVFPSWDNSPRRKSKPTIFINSTPAKYAFWLSQIAWYTLNQFQGDERLLFINAWNEWGEGCHLEPDEKDGASYLEATRMALQQSRDIYGIIGGKWPLFDQQGALLNNWYDSLRSFYQNNRGLTEKEKSVVKLLGNLIVHPGNVNSEKSKMHIQKLNRQRDEIIVAFRNSLSWRITAPLRKLFDLLHRS